MRPIRLSVKELSVDSMNGRKSSSDRRMTIIFGTKVRVISWICVNAWKNEIARPTTSASSIAGAPSFKATMIASRATERASADVILSNLVPELCRAQIGILMMS